MSKDHKDIAYALQWTQINQIHIKSLNKVLISKQRFAQFSRWAQHVHNFSPPCFCSSWLWSTVRCTYSSRKTASKLVNKTVTIYLQLTSSPDWGKRSVGGSVGGGTAGFFDTQSSGNCKTSNEMLLEIFRFVQVKTAVAYE